MKLRATKYGNSSLTPECDIEHRQTQPSGSPVQLLFQDFEPDLTRSEAEILNETAKVSSIRIGGKRNLDDVPLQCGLGES